MKKQLVMTAYQHQILTALYEDDILYELYAEKPENMIRIGDIYIGKVKNIVPNINAAFVEIKPGILGYYSLKDNENHLFALPKKNQKLVAGDEILVQVEKENLKTKVYSLTGRFSLPGRFLVYKYLKQGIQVSSKIKDPVEKARLISVMDGLDLTDHAWMLRTEAKGIEASLIHEEAKRLEEEANQILSAFQKRTCYSKIFTGASIYEQLIIQNIKDASLRITTDLKDVYEECQRILQRYALTEIVALSYYEDASYSLIKLKNLEAQVEKALAKNVWLKSGAYLVIEPTEALTVIDVNTGKAIGKQNMEDHFFKINMEAAKEACRQLRLRNLSGIIIVDFINMKDENHLKSLFNYLKEEAVKDAVQTSIVDRTALHLIEITRKKTRKTLFQQLKRC